MTSAPVTICPTCGASGKLDTYPDGRAYCPRKDGKGGWCYKNRAVLPPPSSIEAIVLAARTKGATHAQG